MPFDYQLSDDDSALYCVEMTEKAFRSAGIELSKPIRLGDMERASEFPLQMFGLRFASKYALEHPLTFRPARLLPGEREPWDLVGSTTDDRRAPDVRSRTSRLCRRRLPRNGPRANRLAVGEERFPRRVPLINGRRRPRTSARGLE